MADHKWFEETMKKEKQPFQAQQPVTDIDVAHLLLGIANSDLAPEVHDVINKEKMILVVKGLWDELDNLRAIVKKQVY